MTLYSDGNFYGTTSQSSGSGGGTIFKLSPSGTLTTLHDFGGSDGGVPNALTLGKDGNFYGTTVYGGVYGWGTVFKMRPGGAFTSLYSFTAGSDGGVPNALTLGNDGNFYGTTFYGGAGTVPYTLGPGTIFRITPSGVFTTLYSFTDGADGAGPYTLVQAKDGNFYGTTNGSGIGASPRGTVFKITPSGTFTTLYSFTDGNDGAFPRAGLTLGKDSNLYGTTAAGGANQMGAIFRITSSGAFTTLYSFTGGSDGASPQAVLTLGKDGNFCGTNSSGGTAGDGVIFQVTASGMLTPLYNFTTSGDNTYQADMRQAGLTLGDDGNFYGLTQASAYWHLGPISGGTLFRMTPAGAVTTLYAFTWAGFGWSPHASLTLGEGGNFFGTASGGGVNNDGTIFTITPEGRPKVLHDLDDSEGSNPNALTLGKDRNFYGTTYGGGAYGNGTIFRITPSGVFTTLYSFTGGNDGANPNPLTLSKDGNLYGTAQNDGANGDGTVFKITPSGIFTLLYTFTAYDPTTYLNTDGANPMGALVLGKDGNFYGATNNYGGAYGNGTIFRITPSGILTTVYSFTGGNDGYGPAYLALGDDGNFYGTTPYGSTYGFGNVFQVTPGGTQTTLYSFTGGNDGGTPLGALTLGKDRNFYGTTSDYGGANYSTMFQITPAGVLTTLSSDLHDPFGALAQGKDGNFYGTNSGGAGGIFQITPGGVLTSLWWF
jgi:uncharacterized repeat protein (TIGR03803 family)